MKVLIADRFPGMKSALKLLFSQFEEIKYISEVKVEEDLTDKITKEAPDILLIDCNFYGNGTQDSISSVKACFPNITLIALCSDDSLEKKYLKSGADYFILKSNSPDRLFNLLKNIINKKEKV